MNLTRDLNEQQLDAVTHGEGPQLVIAGAGSGKTRVITYRIAWLVRERRVEPYRIAAVTFTNKAAGEMKERVEALLDGPNEVFVGTFHRFSLRLLRRYGERVGLAKGFNILDTTDQLSLMKRAIELEHLDPSAISPRGALSRVSSAKNQLIDPAQFEAQAHGYWEQKVAQAYSRYQRLLRETGGVDFDDMIGLAVRLLQQEKELGERMRRRLRFLLVDEFQDTNYAQLQLISEICGPGGNLTAVGDEDQSIYRWRGAELQNILDFESSFDGAVTRKLERNYRSTQNILDASGAVVANNEKRRGKKLWTDSGAGELIDLFYSGDEGDEARWIVDRIRELAPTYRFSGAAVLVRTNAQTRALEDELLRQKVPYRLIAGVRFYERAEIKDLIAYLRLVRNPSDNLSLRRVLNQPPRGIGKATQAAVFAEAEEMGHSIWDVLRLERFNAIAPRGANALRGFRKLIEELRELALTSTLSELLDQVIERVGYTQLYRKDDPEGEARLLNIQELQSAAQDFTDNLDDVPALLVRDQPVAVASADPDSDDSQLDLLSGAATPASEAASSEAESDAFDLDGAPLDQTDALTSFLDYVSLVSDTDQLETDAGVSLMTFHSAKGLEFPVVFLGGLEDGLLPHFNSETPEELEEERRLLYVGMTRARERLLLTTCSRRRVAGRYQDQEPSFFLDEIPDNLLRVSDGGRSRYDWRAEPVHDFFRTDPKARTSPKPVTARPRRSSASPSTGPSRPVAAVAQGMGVKHPKLGKGVVLEIDGEGENAKLTVFFDRAGKRRLIAKYAGLEPAD